MKARPDGFLTDDKISHTSEAFDYIVELHSYLWKFVRLTLPGASGSLSNHLDRALSVYELKQAARAELKKELLAFLEEKEVS